MLTLLKYPRANGLMRHLWGKTLVLKYAGDSTGQKKLSKCKTDPIILRGTHKFLNIPHGFV